jgi:hypothetical protein
MNPPGFLVVVECNNLAMIDSIAASADKVLEAQTPACKPSHSLSERDREANSQRIRRDAE